MCIGTESAHSNEKSWSRGVLKRELAPDSCLAGASLSQCYFIVILCSLKSDAIEQTCKGRTPFYAHNISAGISLKMIQRELPEIPSYEIAPQLTDYGAIESCWFLDPKNRPNIHKLLNLVLTSRELALASTKLSRASFRRTRVT